MTPLDAYHTYAARFNFPPTINPPADLCAAVLPYVSANAKQTQTAKTLQQLKDIVSATISEFKNWCKNNDMILNSKKSKILWFCASEPIVAEDIESAKSVRVLGVQFDKNLTFAEHVSNIVDYCKKFRSPLY